MKKERFSFDKAIKNSKFNFCKGLRFAPVISAIILVVGIVLAFTLGFVADHSNDFSSFKVCANTDGIISTAQTKYDLDKTGDFNLLKDEIDKTLGKFGFRGQSFTKTSIDVNGHFGESAMEVRFAYTGSDDKAETNKLLSDIRLALQEQFGYSGQWSDGVSQVQITTSVKDSSLATNCLIATLVAIVLAFVYIAFRFDIASAFTLVLCTYHDLLVMLGLVLICRIPIGINFVAVVMATIFLSLFGHIVSLSRIKENVKSQVYTRQNGQSLLDFNGQIANISIKEMLAGSVFSAAIALIAINFVIALSPWAIQIYLLPMIFAVLATFFSSNFILPGFWAIAFRPKKKKIAK